jgi:hypothetical protein
MAMRHKLSAALAVAGVLVALVLAGCGGGGGGGQSSAAAGRSTIQTRTQPGSTDGLGW